MPDLFQAIRAALADRYQLERELGRGGMATVYLGRELKHGRDIAIKVLRPELAGVMTRGRFLREIRISSSLAHPHIVPLLDSGDAEPAGYQQTLPFYTMPYIEGESLRERLRRERELPLEDVVHIARDVAEALDYAHARGVIHRDIKPENILLAGGQALVADFGIARALKEAVDPDAITSAGMVIGTAAYMSPQQAAGEESLDGRTDIYSLACVVYEMLGGEPPFTGASAQAILARHRLDPVPTLRTLRPAIPESVERAIRRALEKSPGDRFATAGRFVAALDGEPTAATARAPARTRTVRVALAGAALLAAALAWRALEGRAPPLNLNKVVVFPLGETPRDSAGDETGVAVALMIGTALEYTEPLEWIDGLPRIDVAARRDPGLLTTTEARRVARKTGARWYLDGSVVRRRDSVTVILRLNDAAGDSVVARASATRASAEAAQAGLVAVTQVLPRLLSPGQKMADLSVLADRRPAAVALWLQGEREYRSFNFANALEFLQRAIEEDSSLAVAAIRGAQAASWLHGGPGSSELSALALKNLPLLPGRMAPFVRGLDAEVRGQADSALYWLGQALLASPDWTEAHMTRGEVYYHLLPVTVGRLDSLAEAEFTAAALDSGYSPARYHLAELAIRSGDTARAIRAVDAFLHLARRDASAGQRTELELMLSCMRRGNVGARWTAIPVDSQLQILRAASLLAGSALPPTCAEGAFRAVFENPATPLGYRWGAFLGLQGVLAAQGRVPELRRVIDSATAFGLGIADRLFVLDALAGVGVDAEAGNVVTRSLDFTDPAIRPYELWLAGLWFARAGDTAGTRRARDTLAARAARGGDPSDARHAAALTARLQLARGDTAATLATLVGAFGAVDRNRLEWGIGESLAPDRLLYARLLLARGSAEAALIAASVFDQNGPIDLLPFVPASLRLRQQAARELGRDAEARRFAERLRMFEPDSMRENTSPPSTLEGP